MPDVPTIAQLKPPVSEFVRMPEGTVQFYLVADYSHCSNILGYARRGGGKIKTTAIAAVSLDDQSVERLLRCEVLVPAKKRAKPGPKALPGTSGDE